MGAHRRHHHGDLRQLAAQGLRRRVYGGALPISPASGSIWRAHRARSVEAEGARLAREAATLTAQPGQFLFLDAGSTNLALAAALPSDADLTIAVNAPAIAAALLARGGFRVVTIGGEVDPQVGGAIGAGALAALRDMRIDLTFLGACALDDTARVGAFSFEDAAWKRELVAASRTVAVVSTNEKLGAAARFAVVAGAELDHLIVEADADPALLARYAEIGVDVRRAS